MITLKQTGETFSNVYEVKDAVLRMAGAEERDEKLALDFVFDKGTYVLDTPFTLSAKKNPELKQVALSFSSDEDGAVFTSQKALRAEDFIKEDGYYTYQFAKDKAGKYPLFHDFYVNGRRLPIVKTQAFLHAFTFCEDNKRLNSENLEGIYIPEEAAALLPDGDLAPMEFTFHIEWECFVMHAISLDRTRFKLDENGNKHYLLKINVNELYGYVTGLIKCLRPKGREFFLGNHPCLLKEDTWCYDHTKGILYYAPKNGVIEDCSVALLDKLFYFEETEDIRLENLTFTGATDRYTCENGYLSHQANVEKQVMKKLEESAIVTKDVRRFTVERCRFFELGTNGVLMLGKTSGGYIRNCRFEYISMCAISVGEPITPSYQNRDGCFDIRIENNYLYRIAYEFPTAPAIDIFRVDGLSVCHNTIEYCAYTGISVGWGWGLLTCALGEMVNVRDAEIAYNKIVHFMQMLRDGGAIYAVGANCTKEYTRYFNFMHNNFAYRDTVKQTVRGFYLDGSATNWYVYDNVGSGMQRPSFAQWHVPTEFTWNCRIDNTYTTEKVDEGNHAPDRNTILGPVYREDTIQALFQKYPKARDIYEKSGCTDKH